MASQNARFALRPAAFLQGVICKHIIDFAAASPQRLYRAIDATCGNGHDTAFVARTLLENGIKSQIWGFDIQAAAIENTRARLRQLGATGNSCVDVTLLQESHAALATRLSEPLQREAVQLILFNLGYLPGADKSCTTLVDSTLSALSQSLDLLAENGLLCVMVYPGHEEGMREHEALSAWVQTVDQRAFQVLRYGMVNQRNKPPYLLVFERLKSVHPNPKLKLPSDNEPLSMI